VQAQRPSSGYVRDLADDRALPRISAFYGIVITMYYGVLGVCVGSGQGVALALENPQVA
jgi:hypothetical protein